jgi:hypothetical protein
MNAQLIAPAETPAPTKTIGQLQAEDDARQAAECAKRIKAAKPGSPAYEHNMAHLHVIAARAVARKYGPVQNF